MTEFVAFFLSVLCLPFVVVGYAAIMVPHLWRLTYKEIFMQINVMDDWQ